MFNTAAHSNSVVQQAGCFCAPAVIILPPQMLMLSNGIVERDLDHDDDVME